MWTPCAAGAAEAAAPAREGARVVATDVTESPGCRRLDVASEKDWAELAADLREAYGEVHGLVNNAGVTWRARIDDVRPEDMARVHAVNVIGPLLGIQHLAPLMPPDSSIVNVGSSAALTGHCPVAHRAGKWALRGLSHCWRRPRPTGSWAGARPRAVAAAYRRLITSAPETVRTEPAGPTAPCKIKRQTWIGLRPG
ncbi:SDR family oxidoreductase [Streptomyces sp. NPDC048564]|uniref:SDR family NAD(P)-dependent oxidoreductase n=1 Tax=Streptomyces sp. NPDC048564 TaxID=3155760 RepID=UPI00343909D0